MIQRIWQKWNRSKGLKKGSEQPLDFIGHAPMFIMAAGFFALASIIMVTEATNVWERIAGITFLLSTVSLAMVLWRINARRLLRDGYGDVIRDHHRRLHPELYGDAPLPFEPTANERMDNDLDWEEQP